MIHNPSNFFFGAKLMKISKFFFLNCILLLSLEKLFADFMHQRQRTKFIESNTIRMEKGRYFHCYSIKDLKGNVVN